MVIQSCKHLSEHSLCAPTVLTLVGMALGFLVLRQGGGWLGGKEHTCFSSWTQSSEWKFIARGLILTVVLPWGVSAIISTGESILSWCGLTQNWLLSIEEMLKEKTYKPSHTTQNTSAQGKKSVAGHTYDLLFVPTTDTFYQGRNWSSERLSNLSVATQRARGRAKMSTEVSTYSTWASAPSFVSHRK